MISNSGLITYISLRPETPEEQFPIGTMALFMLMLFSSFIINFVLSGMIGEMPYRLFVLNKRQDYLIRSTID